MLCVQEFKPSTESRRYRRWKKCPCFMNRQNFSNLRGRLRNTAERPDNSSVAERQPSVNFVCIFAFLFASAYLFPQTQGRKSLKKHAQIEKKNTHKLYFKAISIDNQLCICMCFRKFNTFFSTKSEFRPNVYEGCSTVTNSFCLLVCLCALTFLLASFG